jgi:CheY-like chemotaxis protein
MPTNLNVEVVPLSEAPTDEVTMNEVVPDRLVLVVDDEPLVADTLSTILARAGYSVMTAYDGASAMEMARQSRPHLLISDVAMPGLTGVELAVSLVAMEPACAVLLFSGHATRHDLAFAQQAGYDFTLLAKPVHPAEMLRQVEQSLHSRPRQMKVSARMAPVFNICASA